MNEWKRKWAWLPEWLHDEKRYVWWQWFEQRPCNGVAEYPSGFPLPIVENRRIA